MEYALSDGRVLLNDVSFRVGDGAKVALIGPNGAGKTTLFRMIAGDMQPDTGQIIVTGGLGVMRQFIGSIRDQSTVRDLLVSVSNVKIRKAAAALRDAESAMQKNDQEAEQLFYAQALSDWGDAGDMKRRFSGISHVHGLWERPLNASLIVKSIHFLAANRRSWSCRRSSMAPTRY